MTMFSSQWFASPGVAAGYEVDYSCRFNDDDSATLSKTYAGAGTSDKISQIEFWFKRGLLATERYIFSVESNSFQIAFDANDKLNIFYFTSSYLFRLHTTQVFRDPHAWYHLTLHLDTTPSTPSASSMGLLINGVAVTAFDTATYPSQNQAMGLGTATNFNIGSNNSPASYYDGYISNFLYCDGNSSSTPYSAEFDSNGVWRPKDASSATFGDNGFWLDFAVAPDTGNGAGNDVSGNDNDFTDSAGLAPADQMTDTPTNNFAVVSTVSSVWGAAVTESDGNLTIAGTAATAWNTAVASFGGITSGKWIIATKPNAIGGGNAAPFVWNGTAFNAKASNSKSASNGWGCDFDNATDFYDFDDGAGEVLHSMSPSAVGGTDYLLLAVDIDNSRAWGGWYDVSGDTTFWADNGTGFTGNPANGTSGNGMTLTGTRFYFGFLTYTGRGGVVDFGQGELLENITIPTGFLFLNTTNLAVPSIADPSAHFQSNARTGDGAGATADVNGATSSTTTLVVDGNSGTIAAGMYVTGTGVSGSVTVASLSDQNNLVLSSAQSLSDGVGLTFSSAVTQTGNSQFGTDLIIIKNMDQTDEWKVVDSVRGATYEINTDAATAQTQDSNGVTAFSATDGYMIGTGAGGYNDNTEDFMDYHFQEGSTPGMGINASVSHTQGSATNIAHGMGLVPAFAMLKETDAATSWWVFHQDLTSKTANYLVLDTAAIQASITDVWGTQTSTNFVIGNAAGGLASGTYVCYSFAEVAGFSTFGSYIGGGSTYEPLIVLTHNIGGLLVKKMTNATNNWTMMSPEQNPIGNPAVNHLRMDTTDVAQSSADSQDVDLLSNGFKIRNGANQLNNSGSTYVFAAWAKNPFGGHGGTFGTGVAPATAV